MTTVISNNYRLLFQMDLADSSSLIYGQLLLIYPDGEAINYVATSGCSGYQGHNDQWIRARGPIPERNDYSIPTKPYYLPTKGIEGNFYHIEPDPIRSRSGIVRGEFGIHRDANVPGSSGCITLKNESGFRAFEERLAIIHQMGVARIPLMVKYS